MQIRSTLDLGTLVRDRRREIGWSQTELARRIGTSRSWVSEVENGKAGVEAGLALKALLALGLVLDVRPRGANTISPAERTAPALPPLPHAAPSLRPALTRNGKPLSAARPPARHGGSRGA
jgi:transcriptional regulator with XRE-family HTH domain